jgi:hypothetical protein
MDQLDREWVRSKASRAARVSYHHAMREAKHGIIAERERLGARFADGPAIIDAASGIGTLDISQTPQYAAAAAECHSILETGEGKALMSKGSLDFIANGKTHFGMQSACVALATSPLLLAPVTRYFGMLPILFSVGLNRARADSMLEGTSHYFHLDPEDVTQLKAFVRLGNVEADRAFHALPANVTDEVIAKLPNYGVGRVTDEKVDELVGAGKTFCGAGPAGHVVFCDTTRCLHFGGRPGRLVRDTLVFHYALPTSTWFPRPDEENGEPRRNLLPMLRATGDDFWDALIGARAV